jgi:hypothetical protein
MSAFSPGLNINSYWDGGSKNVYAVVNLNTFQCGTLPSSSHPYFDVLVHGLANQQSDMVSIDHVGNVHLLMLPEGFALVKAGTFCGKPSTAHVYLNPANMPLYLSA